MPTPKQSHEQEAWDLLRHRYSDEALTLLRDEKDLNFRASLGYGAALMWVGEYKASSEHFGSVIETFRVNKRSVGLSEDHYALAGAGRWCLGDYTGAVKLWRRGIKAPYATYGVCLKCLQLLVVASILAPGLSDREEPFELLKQRASNPRVRDYPGTLAQLIVGTIDNGTLEASLDRRQPRYSQCANRDRRWNSTFYRAVLDLQRSVISRAAFIRLTQAITERTQFDKLDSTEFWWLTRSAEFYVARHEAAHGDIAGE